MDLRGSAIEGLGAKRTYWLQSKAFMILIGGVATLSQ
jgi:hypothetical protein